MVTFCGHIALYEKIGACNHRVRYRMHLITRSLCCIFRCFLIFYVFLGVVLSYEARVKNGLFVVILALVFIAFV